MSTPTVVIGYACSDTWEDAWDEVIEDATQLGPMYREVALLIEMPRLASGDFLQEAKTYLARLQKELEDAYGPEFHGNTVYRVGDRPVPKRVN